MALNPTVFVFVLVQVASAGGCCLGGNATAIKSVMRRGILERSRRCPLLDYLILKLSHRLYMVSVVSTENHSQRGPSQLHLSSGSRGKYDVGDVMKT